MKFTDIQDQFKRYALYERGMRPQSYKSIVASMKMLCKWAETEEITELGEGTVQAFLYWGKSERCWSANTFRNHRQYFKSFFDWCIKQKIIKVNPVANIEAPKLPKKLPRCLTRDEINTVLNRVRWYPWRYQFESNRNETILYLLTLTELRLSEMLNLEVSDVNLESSEIFVRLGKNQKDRIVPIHPRLLPVLRGYIAERRKRKNYSKWFLTGAQSEKQMSGKDVRTICKKLSIDTGIKFTPHMLRHTFGRLSTDADLGLFKIKEIMGHSDLASTQRYLSVSTESIKKSFNAVALI